MMSQSLPNTKAVIQPVNLAKRHLSQWFNPRPLDFGKINAAALRALPVILDRLAPGGTIHGQEWEGRNPRRADRKPGSFKVNVRSGRWADFASGDRGGDVISLVAYLTGMRQVQAARKLANMLGVDNG